MVANSEKKHTKLVTDLLSDARDAAVKEGITLHDLYIYTDLSDGSVTVQNDSDSTLASKVIYDFILSESTQSAVALAANVRNCIKDTLTLLQEQNFFEADVFAKPFSVVYSMANNDSEEAEELLFMDDDLVRIDDPLLANMDQELEAFIHKLLDE
ncbi:MAG: hypothetical protein SPI35_00975 [Porphyromonas sp.]|nr:hypothetical protein [Porphyromonas sp.]